MSHTPKLHWKYQVPKWYNLRYRGGTFKLWVSGYSEWSSESDWDAWLEKHWWPFLIDLQGQPGIKIVQSGDYLRRIFTERKRPSAIIKCRTYGNAAFVKLKFYDVDK